MKSILIVAVALASCAPNPGTLTLVSFSLINPGCGSSDPGENIWDRGSLDIANGQAPNRVGYWVQVNLRLNTQTQRLTTTSGQVLEEANREDFILSNIHLTYTLRKGNGKVKTLTVSDDFATTAVIKSGGKLFLPVNLIGPNASEALFDEIVPTSGGPAKAEDISDLRVGVEVIGHLSGTNVPVTSGKVEFPLEVYNSSPCAAYQNVLFECPFPGQDGTPPKCQ